MRSNNLAAISSYRPQRADINADKILSKYSKIFAHLCLLTQELSNGEKDPITHLCKDIAILSNGRMQLRINLNEPFAILDQDISVFPVSYKNEKQERCYGTLYVANETDSSSLSYIPVLVVEQIASICAWLLYTIELNQFLQMQSKHLSPLLHRDLTKREIEILQLMCLHNSQEEIAEMLCITPATVNKHRQRVYEVLDVHNLQDAIFKAYQLGLFSPLSSSTNRSSGYRKR